MWFTAETCPGTENLFTAFNGSLKADAEPNLKANDYAISKTQNRSPCRYTWTVKLFQTRDWHHTHTHKKKSAFLYQSFLYFPTSCRVSNAVSKVVPVTLQLPESVRHECLTTFFAHKHKFFHLRKQSRLWKDRFCMFSSFISWPIRHLPIDFHFKWVWIKTVLFFLFFVVFGEQKCTEIRYNI